MKASNRDSHGHHKDHDHKGRNIEKIPKIFLFLLIFMYTIRIFDD